MLILTLYIKFTFSAVPQATVFRHHQTSKNDDLLADPLEVEITIVMTQLLMRTHSFLTQQPDRRLPMQICKLNRVQYQVKLNQHHLERY